MKQFLKQNAALTAAIALPLALVLIFAGSALFTKATVAEPRHDFLVATNYNGPGTDAFTFNAAENRLAVHYVFPGKSGDGGPDRLNVPRLWRVHAPDMRVEEIPLPVPAGSGAPGSRVAVGIPSLANVNIANTQPGPDGYVFENSGRFNDTNLMLMLFSGERRDYKAVLVNKGRVVPVRYLGDADTYSTRFIGWIIGDK